MAESAIQGQRHLLMSEASAEVQHRTDVYRQFLVKIEEDERLLVEQLKSILSQVQAETACLRSQLAWEENSREQKSKRQELSQAIH